MNTRARRTAARLGLLAKPLALAAALVVGSWLNYGPAQSAVATLNRGQSAILVGVYRETDVNTKLTVAVVEEVLPRANPREY